MIPVNKLEHLGFEDPESVHLLLYAIANGFNEKHIRVSSKDKALIQKLNLLKTEITEEGLRIVIGQEEEYKVLLQATIEFDVETNIDEYRNVFKGIKPNSMGSKNTVRTNLTDFLYKHKQYKMSDILEAAKIYVNHFDGESIRYARQADYFIFKQQYTGSVKTSTLLDVLESPENYKSSVKSWSKLI
jgi:hypothetical protein